MTAAAVSTCCGIALLLAAACSGGRQYAVRKIRHDHKLPNEGTQPDIDFEFETTRGFQFDYGEYGGDPATAAVAAEDVTLDVVHGLFDTRKGIVPNVVYQGG